MSVDLEEEGKCACPDRIKDLDQRKYFTGEPSSKIKIQIL